MLNRRYSASDAFTVTCVQIRRDGGSLAMTPEWTIEGGMPAEMPGAAAQWTEGVTMFLNYFALGALIVGISLVIYTFIYIHDIPYQIAKKRDHDQKEAIHLTCWLSLFTLHAIWPIVF